MINNNSTIFEKLSELRILPVIKISDERDALPLAEALIRGGLPAAEITFRTDCAANAIAAIKNAFPDMLLGAGTVLSEETATLAKNVGATFIVSPGLNANVVRHCQKIGVPIIPGCVTPTEIETAMSLGINVVKFFPASAFGGVETIKALAAPYAGIKFVPTGGVNLSNLREYLSCSAVLACGGSFMVKESLINNKDWSQISKLAREAVTIAKGLTSL
ncbi:MAG: bifunctional 4-hydroxy-2-oxoglutarate aldolase/2-dehydro-3-deoxy-phosphogluconate aldolase [Clostridiales bacterium]|nr:bifunctional 4-hydroxy-2-oxoglutarate aldolase/2-dehydro-3-deoxy-phosphogluconate aldolase [Clostridiales bacterium]